MNEAVSRKRSQLEDLITLGVGGELFSTTVYTLSSGSTYFSRMLMCEWCESLDREIFLDRDPEAFRILLSCMRVCHCCPRTSFYVRESCLRLNISVRTVDPPPLIHHGN